MWNARSALLQQLSDPLAVCTGMVPQSLMTGLEMVETKYKKMLTGGRHTNDKQLFRHTCIIPTMLKTAVRLTCKKIATVPFCKPDMFIGTMGTLRSSGFAVAKLPFSLRIDAILKSLPSRLLRFWSLNDFKPSKVYPAASSSFPWLTHKTVRGRRRRHVVGAEVLSSGSCEPGRTL